MAKKRGSPSASGRQLGRELAAVGEFHAARRGMAQVRIGVAPICGDSAATLS